jgi:Leucine-rich repeat (LRR) protein
MELTGLPGDDEDMALKTQRRSFSTAGNAELEKTCKLNGWSEDYFIKNADKIRLLELFWGNYHAIPSCMHHFTGLDTILISNQPFQTMSNFDALRNLTDLQLNDNKITRISGLDNLAHLKKLYLYRNRIAKMEGLENLVNLETLWLSDNEIRAIEGLECLPNLKTCWLAGNKICRIEASFDCCTKLEEINLSANLIGCFREIPNLARLPSLRRLSFNDNLFGDNPVVTLCNYQTYVLFHLQNVATLDGCPLSDEAKHMAEATYMKKKMYYNMRIKTMKRNCTNVLKKAQEAKQSAVSQNNLSLNVLVRAMKDIERELDEIKYLPPKDTSADPDADALFKTRLQTKLEALQNAVNSGRNEVQRLHRKHEMTKSKCYGLVQQAISHLILELETGGNIRLEDGKPSDVWYSSCVDLVQSRFFAQDYRGFNIAGLKVTRVHRVHNRFLRNRFDAQLESLVNVADPSYKKSLEYLFYGEIADTPSLQTIVEDGFLGAEAYADRGMHEAVPLSNSVSTSDLPRVRHLLQQEGLDESALTKDDSMETIGKIRTGKLLIAKVYLGKYVQENRTAEYDDGSAEKILTSSDYQAANSVFRVKPGDSKQRQWFIFDHALALPEYVIEFEYQLKIQPIPPPPEAAKSKLLADLGLAEAGGLVRDVNGADYSHLGRPLAAFVETCAVCSSEGRGTEVESAAVNMPPVLAVRPKMFLLSEKLIFDACRTDSSASIVYLNLHGNNIRKMDGFVALVNCRTLILSFNEIQKIDGISELQKLDKLDLGYNLIKKIENLRNTQLRSLELNNNLLYRLDDVQVLQSATPGLTELNLSHNALCDVKGYRMFVLRRLQSLKQFDYHEVNSDEQTKAASVDTTLTDDLLRSHCHTKLRSGWSSSTVPAEQSREDALAQRNGASADSWRRLVQEVDLDHQGLRKMQNLDGMIGLRRASFCDNELTKIEGLNTCTALEELILEENRISQLDGMASLAYLKRLDLGKNRLNRIEGLDHLTRLTQLSVEDNEINALSGLSKLQNLMELYIGNNKITELKQVLQVKDMPKLIILDLSGNELCSAPDYRHYTIYHVRKLKVLDGVGVEMAEQETAKEKYDGKLTIEFVVERVGHSFLEHVRELNLAASRVRDVGEVLKEKHFPSLKEVNLDNNQLTDLSGLQDLPQLSLLRLNHNRIEHLGLSGSCESGFLAHLEVLHLGYNHINYIPALRLHCLPELKVLYLQGNDITKVEGLERCIQLRELVLDKNKIKAVVQNAFTNLTNLRVLRIDENGMRSLSNIAPLPRLQSLSCASNRIAELAETDKIAALPSLTDLNFSNCPVCRKQLYRPTLIKKFPVLRILDTREVTMEERERTELLFSTEPRNSPTFATDSKYVLSTKVPIKLTSMNFEALTVRQSMAMAAEQAQHGPGGQMMGAPDGGSGGEHWNPYTSAPPAPSCPTLLIALCTYPARVRLNLFAIAWLGNAYHWARQKLQATGSAAGRMVRAVSFCSPCDPVLQWRVRATRMSEPYVCATDNPEDYFLSKHLGSGSAGRSRPMGGAEKGSLATTRISLAFGSWVCGIGWV